MFFLFSHYLSPCHVSMLSVTAEARHSVQCRSIIPNQLCFQDHS